VISQLRALFLAAEADPLVKIGGLGDVAGSLPLALRALSCSSASSGVEQVDVRLALPYYGMIRRGALPVKKLMRFDIPYNGVRVAAEVYQLELSDMPVYLIAGAFVPTDAPVYFSDAYADGLKFTFFSLAALELARRLDWRPHLVHANDWHTAPAVYALGLRRDADPFYRRTSTLLGLHNLPYMGDGAGPAMLEFGLPPASSSALPWWAQDMPLPLGLLSADHIVAVSPTYAREILTPEYGLGLEAFLRKRSDSLSGILNGLDVHHWDPQIDPHLVANYDEQNLALRPSNKVALQAEFGLEQDTRLPLLGMIGRLEQQKGVDLLPEALRLLIATPAFAGFPWQLVVLGTGDAALEEEVRRLEGEFPRRIRVAIRFDQELSHRIYAGADLLLIPSRYEPCGLTQMVAMRYGCVPLARATGGLRDTVLDYEASPDSTGFLFQDATPQALAEAIGRALSLYSRRKSWLALQRRGMRRDFSWRHSACQYLDLYIELVRRRDNTFL
jgi:starch synthase